MSSVLETFFILFDSNADKVKKGEQDATVAGTELNATLGTADATGAAMASNLIGKFGELAVAIGAAFSLQRLAGFVAATTDYNAQLAVNADRLGLSVEDIDAWSKATVRAGGSAEGFVGTLDFLNKGLAGLNTPGGVSRLKPFLEELKIDPHKVTSSLALLQLLSDKSKELGAQKFAGIAERFGLDPGTQLLIANGAVALDAQIKREKELGVATRADADEARKYKQALADLSHQFEEIATTIGNGIIPKLLEFFEWVGKTVSYLGQHRGLIEGFFIGIGGAIAAFYLPEIVAAAAATWALLAPILAVVVPILAVGAAIALVTDDVQNFLAGNKSVIGELSKRWPELGETVKAAVADMSAAWRWWVGGVQTEYGIVKGIIDLIGAMFAWVGGVGAYAFNAIAKALPGSTEAFRHMGEAVEWVVKLISELVGWFAKLGLSALNALPKALENFAAKIKAVTPGAAPAGGLPAPGAAGGPVPVKLAQDGAPRAPTGAAAVTPAQISGAVKQAVVAAQASIHLADMTPLNSINSTAILNQRSADRSVTVQTGPITIVTQATEPADIAGEFSKHLDNAMRQAIDHFDDGVKS